MHLESGRWQLEQWVAVEMGCLFQVSQELKSRRRAVNHSLLLPPQADEPDLT